MELLLLFFLGLVFLHLTSRSSVIAEEAPPPPPKPPPEVTQVGIPHEFSDYMKELEDWALANKRDARRDTIAFWMLKLPAILTAASA